MAEQKKVTVRENFGSPVPPEATLPKEEKTEQVQDENRFLVLWGRGKVKNGADMATGKLTLTPKLLEKIKGMKEGSTLKVVSFTREVETQFGRKPVTNINLSKYEDD